MPQPVDLPRWANLGGIVVDPGGLKDNGYPTNAIPTEGNINWLFNRIYQWTVYLQNLTAETLTWTGPQTFTGGTATLYSISATGFRNATQSTQAIRALGGTFGSTHGGPGLLVIGGPGTTSPGGGASIDGGAGNSFGGIGLTVAGGVGSTGSGGTGLVVNGGNGSILPGTGARLVGGQNTSSGEGGLGAEVRGGDAVGANQNGGTGLEVYGGAPTGVGLVGKALRVITGLSEFLQGVTALGVGGVAIDATGGANSSLNGSAFDGVSGNGGAKTGPGTGFGGRGLAGTGGSLTNGTGATAGSGVVGVGGAGSTFGVGGFGAEFSGGLSSSGRQRGLLTHSLAISTTHSVSGTDINFDGATVPATTTAQTKVVTAKNINRVWAKVDLSGGGATLINGFNVASISAAGNNLNINFAGALSNPNACVTLASFETAGPIYHLRASVSSTSTVVVKAWNAAGAAVNINTIPDNTFSVTVVGD